MATPFPTLCEVIYDQHDQGDVYGQSEIPFIPYRHRSVSGKLNNPIHYEHVPYHEVDTSSGYYNESHLIGCRTPQSYGTSLRRPTTGLSTYTAYPTAPSRAFTLPPGFSTDATSPCLTRDSPTQHVRQRRDRARTAPCTSMPDIQSGKCSPSYSDVSLITQRRHRRVGSAPLQRVDAARSSTIVTLDQNRPSSEGPLEIGSNQCHLEETPDSLLSSQYRTSSKSTQLRMVETLNNLRRYYEITSGCVYKKIPEKDFEALNRNECLDLGLPEDSSVQHHSVLSKVSSLEVEQGSCILPPLPGMATRDSPRGDETDALLKIFASQTKTYLPQRRGTAFSMQSHLSSKVDTRDDDKVQWVDALNRWVAENKTSSQMPYMTFVNSIPLEDRPAAEDDWITEELRLPCPNVHCARFLNHMNEHQHSFNAHKQEIILRRRRIRAQREAELKNKRDKKIQVQLEPSKSPSRVRFESPRAPTVRLPTPPAETGEKSPEPVPSSVTPWSEPSQTLSAFEKNSLSRSPTPTIPDEFRKASSRSDEASSPSPKEMSPVPDVVIAPPESEKEDSEPEREPTPEPTAVSNKEMPKVDVSHEYFVEEESEGTLEKSGKTEVHSSQPSRTREVQDSVPPGFEHPPKLEPPAPIGTSVSGTDIQLPSSISPPSTPFKTPDGSSLASPTTQVFTLKSTNSIQSKPKSSKKNVEKTNKGIKTNKKAPKKPTVTVKEKKRSTPPKVVIQDSKSLELDVTSADRVDLEVDPTPRPGSSPGRERQRRAQEKRDRWKRTSEKKMIQVEHLLPSSKPKDPPTKRSDEWIYGDDDFSAPLPAEDDVRSVSSSVLPLPSPSLPESISLPPTPEPKRKLQMTNKIQIQLRKEEKRRWGAKKIDRSLAAERRREELEEERKKRLQELNKRIHSKKKDDDSDVDLSQGPSFDEYGLSGVHFEDYGWLAKYCIFNKSSLEIYKKTFDAVDDRAVGWLSAEDTMIALRAVNRTLTSNEEQYIKRILEIAGYKVDVGSDFKLFAVIAALSQKITALDDWMKNIIGQLDYKMLDMKMFKCRMLWECNVDPDINKIPLDQLCVELRAGGVANENVAEVRQKLSHLEALDLLDFMTYIPLFIMIHESVVDNPLDDTHDK